MIKPQISNLKLQRVNMDMEAKGNDNVLIKQESIIARLRGRLKLDQQTAKKILESPEIEYEAF
jgi:hypothetical protein